MDQNDLRGRQHARGVRRIIARKGEIEQLKTDKAALLAACQQAEHVLSALAGVGVPEALDALRAALADAAAD